jgi:hypothetical protein
MVYEASHGRGTWVSILLQLATTVELHVLYLTWQIHDTCGTACVVLPVQTCKQFRATVEGLWCVCPYALMPCPSEPHHKCSMKAYQVAISTMTQNAYNLRYN